MRIPRMAVTVSRAMAPSAAQRPLEYIFAPRNSEKEAAQ
jgi:hypothetical protein